jgi:hypothetical protein
MNIPVTYTDKPQIFPEVSASMPKVKINCRATRNRPEKVSHDPQKTFWFQDALGIQIQMAEAPTVLDSFQ